MYEYYTKTADDAYEAENEMNEMAKDGWRVVAVTYDSDEEHYMITFERIK